MSRGVFVTGTDTGVGKTLAACALVHALRARGLRVAPMKPVAAGAVVARGALGQRGHARAGAGRRARARRRSRRSRPCCCASRWRPTSPPRARGATIAPRPARRGAPAPRRAVGLHRGRRRGRLPRAPGPGARRAGPRARRCGLPVVLVVGLRLGCLNHALLTAESVARAGLRLAGWIANAIDPAMAARRRERGGARRAAFRPAPRPLSALAAGRGGRARRASSTWRRSWGEPRGRHPLRPGRHAHRSARGHHPVHRARARAPGPRAASPRRAHLRHRAAASRLAREAAGDGLARRGRAGARALSRALRRRGAVRERALRGDRGGARRAARGGAAALRGHLEAARVRRADRPPLHPRRALRGRARLRARRHARGQARPPGAPPPAATASPRSAR